ncbi:MAG: RES domain-containing protein [Saprospiraceae bacterium]|nr:RES domain-containing protein [Saprospiraceae bacterium]
MLRFHRDHQKHLPQAVLMMKNYPICSKHFEDPLVISHIKSSGQKIKCAICKKKAICVEVRDLAEVLEEAVLSEYDDPYSRGAPYDKEQTFYEDRFPGISVSYTEEVLQGEFGVDDGDIAADIAAFFEHAYLSTQSIWTPEEHERLIDGWQEFKEVIKHKIRFLFFRPEHRKRFENPYGDFVNPFDILDEVCSAITRLNLITRFPIRQLKIFRAQQHTTGEKIGYAKRLGSPPGYLAKDNRMSPAGISMFYGAFDPDTCFYEVADTSWTGSEITTGTFTNLKALNLIDFTKFKGVPSLLDKSSRGKRAVAKFIQSFLRDVAIPIKPDDKILDYIPTQVVTEYLRYVLSTKMKVHGLIYRSVKNPGGKCVVLFVDNDQIVEDRPEIEITTYSELFLSLVEESITTQSL